MSASADVVFRQLSLADSYAFYGNDINITYYSTTGYKQAVLHPWNTALGYVRAGTEINGVNVPDWVKSSDLQYCLYTVSLSDYSFDPSYLGIDIMPNIHFDNCNGLRFCAAAYIGQNTVSSAAYDDSFISIYGQTNLRYSNTAYSDNNIFPYWRLGRSSGVTGNRVLPVWADYQSDVLSTVNMMRIGFNGARLTSGSIDIYLSCPLINADAVGGTGIVTGTTAPSQGDINVNIDLDETNDLIGESNTLIGRIIDFLHYIGETIVGDESEVEEVEPIMTAEHPPDYDAALSEAESVMDDIPDITASGGFIWEIYKRFMDTSPVIKWLVPFGLILTIFSYIFWKK